jgi:vancomycin resistance protein VanJ
VQLVTAHLISPRGGLNAARHDPADESGSWRQNFADRLQQAQTLAGDVAALPEPRIVAGDFNAPEASPVIRTLQAAGLRDAFSAAGRGWGFSYGHALRWGLPFLRIDHILVGRGLGVARCVVGSGRASDHLAVIADIVKLP